MASRLSRLSGGGAIQAFARAEELEAQGLDLIHLEIGELDLETPAHIVEAGRVALQAGRTRYGPTAGTPELRQAIAGYVNRSRATAVSPQEVLVTPGVKGALYFTIMALIDSGDEVILPDPGFPAYSAIVRFAGGIPISLPLRASDGFQPDLAELRSLLSPRTKLIILNSPANPTGVVLSRGRLASIAEIAQEHDLWVISDEIYAQLYFTPVPPPTIYAFPGMPHRTILMDGFSKAYAMIGPAGGSAGERILEKDRRACRH
jgi:aspartate/methionine/tyrosine aminotransferase